MKCDNATFALGKLVRVEIESPRDACEDVRVWLSFVSNNLFWSCCFPGNAEARYAVNLWTEPSSGMWGLSFKLFLVYDVTFIILAFASQNTTLSYHAKP